MDVHFGDNEECLSAPTSAKSSNLWRELGWLEDYEEFSLTSFSGANSQFINQLTSLKDKWVPHIVRKHE